MEFPKQPSFCVRRILVADVGKHTHAHQADCLFLDSPIPDRSLRLVTNITDDDGHNELKDRTC